MAHSLWLCHKLTILAVVFGFCSAPCFAAATLWSTNDGVDSDSYGSNVNPCRSISQAVENASDGDTIWVGAGHCGDLGGDGKFDSPGSEHPQVADNGHIGCIV
jgi:hypothetical protein